MLETLQKVRTAKSGVVDTPVEVWYISIRREGNGPSEQTALRESRPVGRLHSVPFLLPLPTKSVDFAGTPNMYCFFMRNAVVIFGVINALTKK